MVLFFTNGITLTALGGRMRYANPIRLTLDFR